MFSAKSSKSQWVNDDYMNTKAKEMTGASALVGLLLATAQGCVKCKGCLIM